MTKPDFDAGVPSLEETLNAIKTAAAREPSHYEESAPETPAEQPAAASVPDVPAPVVEPGEVPGAAQEGTPPKPPAPQKETVSAALARLMAREAALVEREAKLKEATPATPPSPAQPEVTLDEIRALYRRDKIAALKLLDEKFNPQKTAKEFWYRDLGDLAPKEALAEYQAESALGYAQTLEQKMETTKQEILREIQEQRNAQAYEQYVGAVQAYTASVPADLPLVKKFTERKPEKVVQALIGVARKHAQATNGQILTPAQAASKLEASLKELQLVDTPAAPVTPTAQTAVPATPNTLRNKHTAVQPSLKSDDSLDDAALRERARKALEQAKRAALT